MGEHAGEGRVNKIFGWVGGRLAEAVGLDKEELKPNEFKVVKLSSEDFDEVVEQLGATVYRSMDERQDGKNRVSSYGTNKKGVHVEVVRDEKGRVVERRVVRRGKQTLADFIEEVDARAGRR